MVILPALPAPHRAGGCGGDSRCVGGFGRTAWRNASPCLNRRHRCASC